jgi:P27 family predicted phage terminase small subunit
MDGELVPMAPATTLPKAKGLKGTAKKLYLLVGTELASKGLIDAVNIDLLLAYCREMALYQDMMKDLETEGYTITVATKTGSIKQVNPKRKIAENSLVAAKTLASEFGLSPASRARVAAMLSGIQKKDDFADFETVDEQ